MKKSELISKVREFNRLYMSAMKLLGGHYLGSEYSTTEARVFFEIYAHEGCNAAHIAETMNIDKSYLSKIIAAYGRAGYVTRSPSDTDKRAYDLFLTEKGKARALELIQNSDDEIDGILSHLSAEEQKQLYEAMETIMNLLKKKE